MKVCKFGGSSLCNAEQFKKVRKIIESDPSRRYVVVSAPGKRFADDQKITDALYECCDIAEHGGNAEPVFCRITARYDGIIKDLGLGISLKHEYKTILGCLQAEADRDYIASRGEYLCARIMAAYLGYDFVDAAEVIVFHGDGTPDIGKTDRCMRKMLRNHPRAVIPGFYGLGKDRKIMTFSRGGGDITGALAARGIGADVYENWTDVPGVLTASPALIPNAVKVDFMRYSELLQLCRLGAGVFHADAVAPVMEAGIPTHIRSTNAPDQKGTFVLNEIPEILKSERIFCGVAAESDGGSRDGGRTDNALLHLVGCRLSPALPDMLSALSHAGIDPLFVEEHTNDWVFGIKKQQIAEASAAVYKVLAKGRYGNMNG